MPAARVPPVSQPASVRPPLADQPPLRAWLLGLLGVWLFALTIPMTRLASGDAAAPQLPPAFVAAGRAAVAGVLAGLWLLATRAPRPNALQWRWLWGTGLGVVLGFPLCLGLAVQQVPAAHAAMVTGLLPLATALIGAALTGQRPGRGFWLCAALGAAVVVGHALQRSGWQWHVADTLLLAAVALGGWGYVAGARLSVAAPGRPAMAPEQVICWVLVAWLPLTVPLAGWTWPVAPASAAAWGGFAYVALVSMWLGFFAWYRALALGGMLRISQVQLLQPFLSMLLAVPILGERLDGWTVACTVVVMATVAISRRQPVAPARPAPVPPPTQAAADRSPR